MFPKLMTIFELTLNNRFGGVHSIFDLATTSSLKSINLLRPREKKGDLNIHWIMANSEGLQHITGGILVREHIPEQ